MIADKYVSPEDSKQDVIGLDVASLSNDHGRTPVLATAEADQMVLHWYCSVPPDDAPPGWRPVWRQHRIRHERYSVGERYGDIERMHSLPWAQRVGLVCADENLVLFFKRRINDTTTLYISRFAWDGTSEDLTPVDAKPLPVPIDQSRYLDVGYSLWAGFDEITQSAVALIQTFRSQGGSPSLTLLRITLDDIVNDPTAVAAWRADDVAPGGYDLDARLLGGRLTYLFREQPDVINVQDDDIRFDGSTNVVQFLLNEGPSLNPPLSIRTLDLSTMADVLSLDDVPGGLHPQLQHVDPLYITCDVVGGGEVRIAPDLIGKDLIPTARFGRLVGEKRLHQLKMLVPDQ